MLTGRQLNGENAMRLRASDREHAQPGPDVNACRATSERGFSDGHTVAHPSRGHPAILAHLRLRRLEARLIGAIWGG